MFAPVYLVASSHNNNSKKHIILSTSLTPEIKCALCRKLCFQKRILYSAAFKEPNACWCPTFGAKTKRETRSSPEILQVVQY
ncbi:uncharacterized protein LOC141876303 isoform X3 [Acropora palmata]|uniref:uncharacterized protein LOC141876303 isoform X3 n=1 Tax=Acropora palmata TaxID=6131 RepID=UPI003DA149EB